MKKFLLCMSCFLLLTFVACADSADNGIESEVEKGIKAETEDVTNDTQDTVDVTEEVKNTTNDTGNTTKEFKDTTGKVTPDVSGKQDGPFTFDIADYYTEGREQNTSPDTYRAIYAQIIKELPEDMDFALICLDDDGIPELVIQPERGVYFIYTVRNGKLFCLLDSFTAKELAYFERSSIICQPGTSHGGGDTGGYGWYCYRIPENQTITDDIKCILTWYYEGIYDENDNFMGEGEITCSYMGQEIDEEAYEEVCKDLGIADKERKSLCVGSGIEKEAAIQLLSSQDSADSESPGNLQTTYREVYKKKLENLSNDMAFSFIYLDDNDIPELAACKDESVYSIYTVRDGALVCIADSIETEHLSYYERQNIICASVGYKEGSVEKRNSYYQISSEGILTNDSQPIVERSNDILYDENGNWIDEETPNRYRYMGQNTNRKTYDKICKELGITEDMEMKGMCTGNSLEKEISLELLNP